MNKVKFTMLVGVSGSGKSSMADFLAKEEGAIVVSTDSIREELFGDENIQGDTREDKNKVFEIAHKRITEALKTGGSVIYDATNLSMKRRMNFLKTIEGISCHKRCIVMVVPYYNCVMNNEKRERKVPLKVMHRQLKNFQFPGSYEGWNEIVFTGDGDKSEVFIEDLTNCDLEHDNHHHSLSIQQHSIKAVLDYSRDATRDGSYTMTMAFAAGYHDIGKFLVKDFHNAKGELTNEAHYYGHQNVGAYYLANYIIGTEMDKEAGVDWYKLILLIQWHMEPYIRKQEGTLDKFYNLVGEDLAEGIKLLHKYDMEAH